MWFGRRFLTKLLSETGEVERLDRFELIADIASGGMATVYLARLSGVAGFQRLVAIKRLHPHLAREREFVDMFLDEARLAARIHHPNVVPIQEIGQSERGYYLVMDYIEGDTAARLFARAAQSGTRVPLEVAVRIVLDALMGLHAAHELKDDNGRPLEIVHRDVSPQNILVGVDGTSRLTDFGVARAASRLSSTRSGQLKGKLAYMAPEQARGGEVDRRADVFAMGIVAWEALAFRRLFKSDGEAETLNKVLYEPVPTLKSAAPHLPDSLDAVVMKALAREPEKRYATAADFADALEGAARAVQKVGSAREVAAFLDSMVGTDLSQQREAVRAWLARSEPSRNENVSQLRADAASITRVEARPSSPGYGPPSGPRAMPSSPSGLSGPFHGDPVSQPSYPLHHTQGGLASGTPPSLTMPDQQDRQSRNALVGVSLFALFLVGVIAALGAAFMYGRRADNGKNLLAGHGAKIDTTATATTAAASVAPDPSAAAGTSASAAPSASPSNSAASTGSAAATAGSTLRPGDIKRPVGGGGGGQHVVKQPDVKVPTTATTSSGTMPDDISHNPYR